MSKWYIGTDTGSKVLAHYAKGASAKDHKWKTRSLRNGHWVYVYNDSKSGDAKSDNTSPSLERVKQETLARKLKATQKKVQDDIRNKVNATNAQSKYAKLVGNSNNQRPKDSDTPKVSKEYLQELEYNSKKNVFPEGFKTVGKSNVEKDNFEKEFKEAEEQFERMEKAVENLNQKMQQDTEKDMRSMDNEWAAKKAQAVYGLKVGKSNNEAFTNRAAMQPENISVLQKMVSQYKKMGFIVPPGDVNNYIQGPDDRIPVVNPKTGVGKLLPSPKQLWSSTIRQKQLAAKNRSASNTPEASAKSHEVNSNGFKARPATAADADLFKNKSSAETKNKVTISDHGGNTGIKTEVTKKKKKRL